MPSLSSSDRSTQSEFWYQLAHKHEVSNDEAFHAILMFADGKDASSDYSGRVSTLKSRHMLPRDFNQQSDELFDRGTLAVSLVEMLHIKKGVNLSLFGENARYADRLLQFRGLYPTGSSNQVLSGGELVGLIGKAEDYQRGWTGDKPAALLPGEMSRVFKEAAPTDVESVEGPNFDEIVKPLFLYASPTSSPTTSTTLPTNLSIIIDGIEGEFVEVRTSPTARFQPARVGMKLGPEAEFRTGPKSAVRFIIPPDQTGVLDRLGTTSVATLLKGAKVKTDVNMTYGRFRYDLEPINKQNPGAPRPPEFEQGGIEHDTSIHSPNTTLAVRGTRVALYDQPPFVPEAVSLVGVAQFQNARRESVALGSKTTAVNRFRADQENSVETAMSDAFVDPTIAFARTPADTALLTHLSSHGSVFSVNPTTGITIVHGGTVPTDAELPAINPGNLTFFLRWSGDANLNIAVVNQAGKGGEFLYPATGVNVTPSGGRIPFDHQGGPNGGIELAYWPHNFPTGVYSVGINNISGATADATINAYVHHQPVGFFDPSLNGGAGGFTNTFTATVPPGQQAAVIVPIDITVKTSRHTKAN